MKAVRNGIKRTISTKKIILSLKNNSTKPSEDFLELLEK